MKRYLRYLLVILLLSTFQAYAGVVEDAEEELGFAEDVLECLEGVVLRDRVLPAPQAPHNRLGTAAAQTDHTNQLRGALLASLWGCLLGLAFRRSEGGARGGRARGAASISRWLRRASWV